MEQIVEAVEVGIRNTSEKQSYVFDDMNYRIKDDLFLVLAQTTNNTRTFSIFFWLLKNMNKANIVHNYKPTELIKRSGVSSKTFYKFMKDAEIMDLLVLVPISKRKHIVMVNPNFIYNFRKTKSKERIELMTLYGSYKKQKNCL